MNPPAIQIRGIVPPVPTPLTKEGAVDRTAFEAIAAHLQRGGANGAFVLGSTGECASLSMPRRLEAVTAACAAFGGRMPLLVGIGDPSLDHSLMLAERAAAAGADAVVLNAPSYYEISGAEMRGYLDLILPRLDLPVLLYNMPWLTGHTFDEETLRHAIGFPNVIGFKDSSANPSYLGQLVRLASVRPELSVLVGNDFQFLHSLRLGAHGAVAGGSTLYPVLFRSLMDAHATGEDARAEQLQEEIRCLGERIFPCTRQPSSVFAAIKGGLAALGMCRPDMAPPIHSCTPEMVEELAAILKPAVAA
jgi:dihydrodipicolinate synthase/N-acetylneuraminate lyase